MFMGRNPQQVAQDINRNAGSAPPGHPRNPEAGAKSKSGSKPQDSHAGPFKGAQRKRYLDQDPNERDGTPKPGYEAELKKAVQSKDVGMISELLEVITDNEAPSLVNVVLSVLKSGQAEELHVSLEALLDHKTPKLLPKEIAQLVFESLRADLEHIAKHFAHCSPKYDAHAVGVELDKCVVAAKLPDNEDPLLQRLDMFIAEEMPRVEQEINKNLQNAQERAAVDAAPGGEGEGEDNDNEAYGEDENEMQYQRTLNWRDTVDDDAADDGDGVTGYANADEIDPDAPEGDALDKKAE